MTLTQVAKTCSNGKKSDGRMKKQNKQLYDELGRKRHSIQNDR
jgi:hypothetical protein